MKKRVTLSPEPDDLIRALAAEWFHDTQRPQLNTAAIALWRNTIENIVGDTSCPLLLRRSANRGSTVIHKTGREIVFADNSPAIWIYQQAINGRSFDPSEFLERLQGGVIPIALALRRQERELARYTGTLQHAAEWKSCCLSHFDDIGEQRLKWIEIENTNIETLKRRSFLFLSLDNMFVVRNNRHYTQGLGENKIFREELRRLSANHRQS
jgi:hypothetical protein